MSACLSAPLDMGSFYCASECKDLCRTDSTEVNHNSTYQYLNTEEQKLVAAHPLEAITVYKQKNKAIQLTETYFGHDGEDDESDAFRHFVWAGLLYSELGPDRAKVYLDAHEAEESVKSPARSMDLANNRAGQIAAERLTRLGSLNENQIVNFALKALRNKELVVIQPSAQMPEILKKGLK